jgi:hypothetical protein
MHNIYTCFAQDSRFSKKSTCDLDFWPRDMVHGQGTMSHWVEQFYEVALNSYMHEEICSGQYVWYLIIFRDLHLASINFNYKCHTCSHES